MLIGQSRKPDYMKPKKNLYKLILEEVLFYLQAQDFFKDMI